MQLTYDMQIVNEAVSNVCDFCDESRNCDRCPLDSFIREYHKVYKDRHPTIGGKGV